MEYYRLIPDKRISNPIVSEKLPPEYKYHLDRESFNAIKDGIVSYYKRMDYSTLCDIVFRPHFLVSERIRLLWLEVKSNIEYKMIQMIPQGVAPEKMLSEDVLLFWVPFLPSKDIMHEESEYLGIGKLKTLVVDEKKAAGEDILHMSCPADELWVVSLKMAEQLLALGAIGFSLDKLEVK